MIKPSPQRNPQLDKKFFDNLLARHAGRTKDFDIDTMAAWFAMVQTFLAMESRISARVQAHGLTLPGMNVLGILSQHAPDGLPLHELSRYLAVSRANVTGLIDHLVRKELVKRVDHATDRRVILARLTPKGKAWMDAFLPGHFKAIRKILAPLSKTEKSALKRMLLNIRTRLLEEEAE
jgi:DNA-binding MarR family transcriptional regulator